MATEALSIVEVLENLTTLVDAESLEEIEVTNDDRLISHREEEEESQEVYWITAGPDDQTLNAIRRTFFSVYEFLQNSYKKVEQGQDPGRFVEGVGTIMVLVGEATKKLDNLGIVFKEKVTDLDEYKKLQEFYQENVIKGAFSRFAKDLAAKEKKERIAAREEGVDEVAGVHILNDIEIIKGDHLYELFYLKNEEGHPFFTRDLARNIKLACDFGEFSKEYFGEDPLLQIKNWEDKHLQIFATTILQESKRKITRFYKEAMHYRRVPFVILINNALIALMLASNTRNLIRQFSLKGCHRYFADFVGFLREILQSRDYQRELLYPSKEPFFANAQELVRELSYQLYALGKENRELKEGLLTLAKIDEIKKRTPLSEILTFSYKNLESAFVAHPSGPVFKALDLIREEERPLFDPLMLSNFPEVEHHIKENEHEITLLRMACPTMQEVISRAYIVDEFKEYLRASIYHKKGFHHLLINYQDKTSWKEHARSHALEELQSQAEFSDLVTIVTLSKDGDFYHQRGGYEKLSDAKEFMKLCAQHFLDEGTGYYFPKKVKDILAKGYLTKLLTQIHKSFFTGQDILSVEDRQNFIEILYAFIELKLMELTHCTALSLTSKDGLDVSATGSLALLILLRLSDNKPLEKGEIAHFIYTLFGQTLMMRERNLDKERFHRLVQFVKVLEKKSDYLTSFAPLLDTSWGCD